MSAIIKLSSKLPGDEEINGLDANVGHFLEDQTPVLCLAWVVAKHVTRNIETGDEVPTVEVRRIEPIGTPDVVPQHVQDLAAELYEMRTGRNPLPIGELLARAGDVQILHPDVSEEAEKAAEERERDAVKPEPRLSREPAQIGEIFSFEKPASAEA